MRYAWLDRKWITLDYNRYTWKIQPMTACWNRLDDDCVIVGYDRSVALPEEE